MVSITRLYASILFFHLKMVGYSTYKLLPPAEHIFQEDKSQKHTRWICHCAGKAFGRKVSLIVLNADMKATRKRVEWDGQHINMCRVVNLIANNYLMTLLLDRVATIAWKWQLKTG